MLETIDIDKYNFPTDVKEGFKTELVEKGQTELIAFKAMFAITIKEFIDSGSKEWTEEFWAQHEVSFLNHGTDRRECKRFVEDLLVKLFFEILNESFTQAADDTAEEAKL